MPRGAVGVTFDDGYGDNLRNAKPILDRHRVPATVFVTSGYVGARREFWWDELGRVVLHAPRVPERCRSLIGAPRELGDGVRATDADEGAARRSELERRASKTIPRRFTARSGKSTRSCRCRPLMNRERCWWTCAEQTDSSDAARRPENLAMSADGMNATSSPWPGGLVTWAPTP